MTVAPHPAAHRRSPPPPAARRNTSATPARGRQSSCDRGQRLAPAHRRHRKPPTIGASAENTERRRLPTPRSPAVRDPQIPIGALAKRSPYLPAVSSLGGFRAPAPGAVPPSQRPAPETLHQFEASKTAIRNGRFTSTSAVSFAQIAPVRRRLRVRVKSDSKLAFLFGPATEGFAP